MNMYLFQKYIDTSMQYISIFLLDAHTFFTMAKVKNRLIQLFLCNYYSSQKIYALLSLMCTLMVFDIIVTFYFPNKYIL